jgi:hypothetical protein
VDRVTIQLLKDLLDDPSLLAPPVAIVPRVAYQGRLTLLSAPRKAGKSTLMGAAASALSRGETFLRQPTSEASVLWVAEDEHIGDTVRRFRAENANPLNVFIAGGDSITDLVREARAGEFTLLVIDAIGDLTSREIDSENDAVQVRRALAPFRTLARDTGMAIVLLHHCTKATGKARGSGVFEEVGDHLLTLRVDEEDKTLRRVTVEGRMAVDDFAFRLTPDGLALGDQELSAVDAVELLVFSRGTCTTRDILDGVPQRKETVQSAIAVLQRQGRIENHGSKHAHKWVTPPVGTVGEHSGNADGQPRGEWAGTLGNTRGTLGERAGVGVPLKGDSPTHLELGNAVEVAA